MGTREDHPRVGGEKLFAAAAAGLARGSPPRGRGKVYSVCKEIAPLGITPAWAGKRYAQGGASTPGGDHPRVGGEKALIGRCLFGLRGSPPRGRGKVQQPPGCNQNRRITPAWAGKSHHFVGISEMVWDHPRVGGEKPPPGAPPQTSLGSPPRGRGKV